uniref:Uncharacterized protein n=1 Tax=Cyprinodon variegatus TaxID=28743 RepID=A0A3Q2E103_CYPVA
MLARNRNKYKIKSSPQQQMAENQSTCNNPGNPVFSCMINSNFKGGESTTMKLKSLLFKTTSSDYGHHPPTYESSPCRYYPRYQTFSMQLSLGGNFRDNSFNTSLDHSRTGLKRTF